jgi:hypothetical protein
VRFEGDMGVGMNTLFDGIGLCSVYIFHSTHLFCTWHVDWGSEMGIFIEILYFTCVKLCSGMHQVSSGKLKYYCLHYIILSPMWVLQAIRLGYQKSMVY